MDKIELKTNALIGEMADTLLAGIEKMGYDFIHAGDAHLEALATAALGSPEEVSALCYHFQLAERAKLLLLLWRDVLFQHLKGKLLLADGKSTETRLREHWEESVATLLGATADLETWATQELEALSLAPQGKKQLDNWRLQNNPWEVLREQAQTIVNQAVFLQRNNQEALGHAQVLRDIKSAALDNCRHYLDEVAHFQKGVSDVLQLLASKEESEVGSIIQQLAKTKESIQLADHAAVFKTQITTFPDALPLKWQIVVDTQGGLLMRSDIDLKKQVGQWLEAEALPLLYEVWELATEAQNGFKMALSNIQNNLQLLPQGEVLDTGKFIQPLLLHGERLQNISQEMTSLLTTLQERLDMDFSLSNTHDLQRTFLPMHLPLSVRQIDRTGGWLLSKVNEIKEKGKALYDRLARRVKQEESMGFAEKTVRYLEHRKPLPDSHAYTSIFLTEGFVGSSFATGREVEMAHLASLVRHWESGYRGAALLTGRRLCGKTFVGEWAASRHFPDNTIRLVAGQETVMEGRKLPATTDLAAVLDFVKKHALQNRPLLWLDDLELWQDANHNFFDNIAALLHFTDHYATQCFVLATTNHWAHRHLQTFFDVDQVFQATLHLDTMPQEDIVHALLIRHGATHKKLVSKESGAPLAPQAFRSLTAKVCKAAHGNIGEALQWWTSSVQMNDDDTAHLVFNDKYSLPENPDPAANLLLEEILWQKKTDEYRLRRQFGPVFSDRYVHLLRRLLGLGLLRRGTDGSLEIDDAAVNAVGG